MVEASAPEFCPATDIVLVKIVNGPAILRLSDLDDGVGADQGSLLLPL